MCDPYCTSGKYNFPIYSLSLCGMVEARRFSLSLIFHCTLFITVTLKLLLKLRSSLPTFKAEARNGRKNCRCHSGFWPPWSKSASGYGPPFADLGPLYQTFLLSIFCIIFGNLFYLQAFLSMSFQSQHNISSIKVKKENNNSHFVPILPHSL